MHPSRRSTAPRNHAQRRHDPPDARRRREPNDNEPLYHSLESGDPTIAHVLDFDTLEELRLLLDNGGDANERPLLHHAILRGRSIAHVRALLDAGANVRAVNEHGVSVFRFATAFGRADIVELLRDAGVDVVGTLSFASQDETTAEPAPRDFAGCARALLAHGVPMPNADDYSFSTEVSAVFDEPRFSTSVSASTS